MRIRWIAEAIGAAVLIMLPYFAPLLFPGHMALYHHYLSFSHLVGGLLLDMLALFLLGFASLASIHRFAPARLRPILGAGIAGILIWRTGNIAVSVGNMLLFSEDGKSNTGMAAPLLAATKFWTTHSHVIALTTIVFLVVLACRQNRMASLTVRAMRVGLASFAFCCVWILAELIYFGFIIHRTPSFDRSVSQSEMAPRQRIIWVLFDELSHDLIFEHPANGERFPTFEQMRRQSVSLDNIETIGMYTDKIIPSLLIDQRLDGIRGTFSGKLLERDSRASGWSPYQFDHSLFFRANAEGWHVGIAGWYNPYCRIFNQVLTSCQWTPGIQSYLPFEAIGASEDNSAFTNALVVPRALIRRFSLHSGSRTNQHLLQQNIRDYYQVMQNSKRLIQNTQVDFIFLHLPVPHPPGIYSRTSHQICECGDYLDNLALADSTLSELLSDVQSTSLASSTTLIISSDHSWRVPFWRIGQDWSQEEEDISRGGFDQKPVFLVHFPSETQGIHFSTPVSEMVEHDLIEGMLDRKIQNSDALTSSLSKAAALTDNSPRSATSGIDTRLAGY